MIDRLSFDDLETSAPEYDDVVLGSSTPDRFCSSSFWILPAARHFSPRAIPRIFRRSGSYVVLGRSSTWLHPLEAMWGLCCPLVGGEPEETVELFLQVLERESDWDAALVTGLSEASPLWRRLLPALARRYAVDRGPMTRRYVANLEDGVEGFLRRRSPGFRRNLERAARRARRMGLTFEVADAVRERPRESFERILDVERRSWKGVAGTGIEDEPMRSFYGDMNHRLLGRDRRRLMFARLEGKDVAYIFGAVFADGYRGLQFSFDSRLSSLSLGNLCQIEEIRRLTELGVRGYDLGSEVRYKRRWGEKVVQTASLVIHR
ncbi:MAG: GNAT family N-acetyltransferase [Vicinamibacteria bacterium]